MAASSTIRLCQTPADSLTRMHELERELPVYTALTIPTVTAYPSVYCLQWSSDGQLCFVSKNAVHILVHKVSMTYFRVFVILNEYIFSDPRSWHQLR